MKLFDNNKVISLTILNELNASREEKDLYLSIALEDRKRISLLEEFDAEQIPEIEGISKQMVFDMAKKEEYQGVVIFLLSEASSYLNGAIIAADGGRSAW